MTSNSVSSAPLFIRPSWAAPRNVSALMTTRIGGVSKGDTNYASFNVGAHCGDDLADVEQNRAILRSAAELPSEPVWLKQTHSIIAVEAEIYSKLADDKTDADASYTRQAKVVCAAMTADCLPVLICNKAGDEVAAIHAGWRGLADGVIEATIAKLMSPRDELYIWLGAAIGPNCFEVGAEVIDIFASHDAKAGDCFVRSADADNAEKWFGNLYQLARQRLAALGIEATQITGGEHCTFTETEKFYSYRRDKVTGRMVSLIWFN